MLLTLLPELLSLSRGVPPHGHTFHWHAYCCCPILAQERGTPAAWHWGGSVFPPELWLSSHIGRGGCRAQGGDGFLLGGYYCSLGELAGHQHLSVWTAAQTSWWAMLCSLGLSKAFFHRCEWLGCCCYWSSPGPICYCGANCGFLVALGSPEVPPFGNPSLHYARVLHCRSCQHQSHSPWQLIILELKYLVKMAKPSDRWTPFILKDKYRCKGGLYGAYLFQYSYSIFAYLWNRSLRKKIRKKQLCIEKYPCILSASRFVWLRASERGCLVFNSAQWSFCIYVFLIRMHL